MTKTHAAYVACTHLDFAAKQIKTALSMIGTPDEKQLLAEALSDVTTVRATLMKTVRP